MLRKLIERTGERLARQREADRAQAARVRT
jgi:hypothetical protein